MEIERLTNEELIRKVLKDSNAKVLRSNLMGGGDKYYENNLDWGWGSNENPFELPEITVTPDGNSWDNTWEDNNLWIPNEDWWNNNDDDFVSGGSDGLLSSETASLHQAIIDGIIYSFNAGSALLLELEDTKSYKLVSATSFVSSVPSFQADLLTYLTHHDDFITKCSRFLGSKVALANGVLAIIGVLDGDTKLSDWGNLASAALGAIGCLMGPTPVGLICGGVSIALSIASTCYSGIENNSSHSGY